MQKVHAQKPLNALVVFDTFNKSQAEILLHNGFQALNFSYIETYATGAREISGTDYVYGQANVALVTDIDAALEIATSRPLHVIVTGWHSSHPTHNILTSFAREQNIPVLVLDRPVTETIMLMAGSQTPLPEPQTEKPKRFIRQNTPANPARCYLPYRSPR